MGRDDRMGRRINLNEPCEIQYVTRDEIRQDFEIDAMNLSPNALATRVERDHSIVDDFRDLINGPAFIWHPIWADDPEAENWRRGFLSIARRFDSTYWKWVFFFDRKYKFPEENEDSGTAP